METTDGFEKPLTGLEKLKIEADRKGTPPITTIQIENRQDEKRARGDKPKRKGHGRH